MKSSSQRFAFNAIAFLLVMAVGASASCAAETNLAPIRLTPQRRQLIGLRTALVERKLVADEIDATGTIEAEESLQTYVQARFTGWIERVFADRMYTYVRKGQPLFTIYSPELVSTEQEYLLVLKARERVDRSTVEGVSIDAASLVDAARERLSLWNVSPREIARLERERTLRHAIEIDSPANGFVVERNALPGAYVQPDTRLFTISDLSKVWAYAAVFQDQIGSIRIGDPAAVRIDAYPGRSFVGRVDSVWPQIDPMTRTGKVRLEFPNRDGTLLPGMFSRIHLQIPMGVQTVVPDSAVMRTGAKDLVFLDRGDGYLMPVSVELGARIGDEFIVRKGLEAGQSIVSSANFLIDSESQLQAAAGGFVPPPPDAANAQSFTAAESTATLDLATEPNPPIRGYNALSVTLLDSANRPIAGAQVKVSFYMAAMPAMGMAAMRAEAVLQEDGNGSYAAPIELPSGGTWSVTISAAKAGQPIAAKQMDISVSGSMAM